MSPVQRPGSSPLARGLLARAGHSEGPVRIIPARAGFTLYCGGVKGGSRDHPRSRGVYRPSLDPDDIDIGSSPLARGLRLRQKEDLPCLRIIPARAGFTLTHTVSRHVSQDHPRSRGVYAAAVASASWMSGSSPLARGLHAAALDAVDRDGIIPARAGFTTAPALRTRRARDHPRSRGVYEFSSTTDPHDAGSSPLARGLRPVGQDRHPGGGIIPARAGFTAQGPPGCRRRRDHPRSRGVYGIIRRLIDVTPGSSPLARGLRPVHAGHVPGRGIIPARAGFTSRTSDSRSPVRDHPRSRGVYEVIAALDPGYLGSSPLARGLRMAQVGGKWWFGIIPARAGFTGGGRSGRRARGDHPRSRGVYARFRQSAAPPRGSSPLARGLHGARAGGGALLGIIPARAGFTAVATGRHEGARDHPRSRGVYGSTPS